MNKELLESKIKTLVLKFEANKYHYLSKNYLEEEVKIDFINPLFEALGWDIGNTKGLSPYERDVVVEKGETLGRPDYNFRIDGQTKFFIEAKAPHEPLHKINHVLQAKSYAWNTKSVFIVLLTDFEEFRLFDATIKPNPKNADQGLIFELTYDQYLDNLDKLILISKEEVEKGSLDKLLLRDPESKRLRKPVDEAFLEDISNWREELAKDIYKNNIKDLEDTSDEGKTKIQVKILNEAVQKILDRLIFIRIAEDRKMIEPKSLLEDVEWWKAGGKRRDLQRRLINRFMGWNQDFNGEILKPGPCDVLEISSGLLAKIIEGLYFPKCPYRFEVIGVELLGSIYERYLGKTIRVTPQRVKIEEKPEVRKAGGVYYTPQYIVDYIVKKTVGKKIKGKTPRQIERIRILDPACGSGSFLLSAYQTLLDYHLDYFEKHPEESEKRTLFPDVITDFQNIKKLSIEKKALILKNNIFGVDIDAQAVEIAMMSLYLKCLEGEKDLPRKKELLPSLGKNIRYGNSLISYDILDQLVLFEEEEKDIINPFDWRSKTTGFGQILETGGFDVVIGNPPYVMKEIRPEQKKYFKKTFKTFTLSSDIYVCFIERGIELVKQGGCFGYIVSNKWMRSSYGEPLRRYLKRYEFETIVDFGELRVFQKASPFPMILIINKKKQGKKTLYAPIKNLNFTDLDDEVGRIGYKLENRALDDEGFSLIPNELHEIIQKIESRGTPLTLLFKTIRRGILTGYNKAFIIDEETKKILIRKDVHSIEIIKKFVSGNDVRRYRVDFREKFLIKTKIGIKIGDYPSIYNHLKQFEKSLKSRWDKGNYWWELRACDYYKEFEKPKIIYGQFQIAPHFTYDDEGYYFGSNHYMIVFDNPDYPKFILGILNSHLYFFYMKRRAGVLGDPDKKGRLIVQKSHFLKFPIRTIDPSKKDEKALYDKIVIQVNKILDLNKRMTKFSLNSTTDKIEREIQIADENIDELVYELYGINKEEKKIIEEGN